MVSWLNCLRNLYGKFDNTKNRRKMIISAFRMELTLHSKLLEAAKTRFSVGACATCQKEVKLHIDHDVKSFAQILDEFMIHIGKKIVDVKLNYTRNPVRLRCKRTAREWVDWHDQHATLIGLCRTCNSSKGSSGYKYVS